jgi:hypothetical protein
VNAGDFGAKITCGTCHAGHNSPQGLQPAQMMTADEAAAFAARQAAMAARQGGAARPGGAGDAGRGAPPQGAPGPGGGQRGPQTPPPPADPIIDKYIAALGGAAVVDKLDSRVMTGTLTSRAMQTMAFTIEQKGAKYREAIQSQPSPVTNGYDGETGWVQAGDKVADIDGFLLQQLQRNADLMLARQLRVKYANLTAARPGQRLSLAPGATPIDVNVLTGSPATDVTERFYFDATSGLLLRRVVQTRTALRGSLVEQYDYSDYKVVSGVKMPFTIKRTNWNTVDTLTIADIKTNTPIDDARFAKPKG